MLSDPEDFSGYGTENATYIYDERPFTARRPKGGGTDVGEARFRDHRGLRGSHGIRLSKITSQRRSLSGLSIVHRKGWIDCGSVY